MATPSVEEVDHALRSLDDARQRLTAAAEASRALIDGLSAALHMRAVQLAARVLPRADDAVLDAAAAALRNPALSSSSYRAFLQSRGAALSQAPKAVTPEQLRAAEAGRTAVERTAAELRARVMKLERELAPPEAPQRGGLLGGLFGGGGKAQPKTAPPAPPELVALRKELASVDDDARAAASEVARLRHAYVKAAEAQAALRSLPAEALTAARAAIAGQVSSSSPEALHAICAGTGIDAIEVDQMTLLRAKQRYAAAVASHYVEAPFLELAELFGDARRWRVGVTEGGLPVPEREFVGARIAQMMARVNKDLAAAARINARLDSFVLESSSLTEPVWDVIFGASEDGDFIEEVRAAHERARPASTPALDNAARAAGKLAAAAASVPSSPAPVTLTGRRFPTTPAEPMLAPFSHLDGAPVADESPSSSPSLASRSGMVAAGSASFDPASADATLDDGGLVRGGGVTEELDTGRWLEQFYGAPLSLDALEVLPTSLDPQARGPAGGAASGASAVFTSSPLRAEDAPRTVTDARVQRRIGPYVLLERIGAGGMAEVHLAQEASTAKRLVVKLIQPSLAGDPAYVAMFEREARIGLELAHEHIVKTHDLVDVGEQRLLILEYVDGLSAQKLCARLRDRGERVPVDVAALLASDCAEGLAYAHARPVTGGAGVVHRDVSPDNLLCDKAGVAKVSDFGIARAASEATLTRTGELKGKLPFMAPELFEGASASPASDVFALGVSFYWFLTGQRPFTRPTEGGTIHAIMTAPPTPPGALVSGVPPEIDLLVVEMIAKDKSERPRAAAVVETLRPFVGGARTKLAALVNRTLA